MRELATLSGPWTGFWVQGVRRGHMRLKITFSRVYLEGGGTDNIGRFSVSGSFNPESGSVTFLKRYSSHQVHYDGAWDGSMISGGWKIYDGFFLSLGDFEIWPESLDEESVFEEREEPEILSLPAMPAKALPAR